VSSRVRVRARKIAAGMALWLALAASAADSPTVGVPAKDFALKSLAGDNVRLSEHLGEVVVINFWASWCSSCRAEMPRLDKLYETYRSAGLALYGVSVDDDPDRAAEFVRSVGVDYPVLLDARKSVAPAYRLDELPMTVLIDRAGIVRHVHHDYSPAIERAYVAQLRALLNE
jgi:peroxiredoxin